MSRIVKVLVVAPLMAVAAAAVFLLVAMRTKSPPMLRAVRQMNKASWNRNAMRTAGSAGNPVAVIHHTGRVSGNAYATPIGAEPVEGGFVVALPYGTQPDWLKNLLVAGGGVIRHDGVDHEITDPQVLPIDEFLPAFGTADQRGFRVFNVTQCLHVRTVASPVGATAGE